MKKDLIQGGIYTFSDWIYENKYLIFVSEVEYKDSKDPEIKKFKFLNVESQNNSHNKVLLDIKTFLEFYLPTFHVFTNTNEEILKKINGFLGCVDDETLIRLKKYNNKRHKI